MVTEEGTPLNVLSSLGVTNKQRYWTQSAFTEHSPRVYAGANTPCQFSLVSVCSLQDEGPLGLPRSLYKRLCWPRQIPAAVVGYKLTDTAASTASMLEFICKFLKDLI